MQVEIDFEVFKALTNMRDSESDSYNEVLRRLLNLRPVGGRRPDVSGTGRILGGRHLPNGTQLRANYKLRTYRAEITDGELLLNGRRYSSASAAARAVTGNNVNGLTFWEVRRPGDTVWSKLSALPRETV